MTTSWEMSMDAIDAVAIGVLSTIFVASLVGIIFICSRRFCCRADFLAKQQRETRPDAHLVENMEVGTESMADVELDDVGMSSSLEEILQDEAWVTDATGLAPHCLAILKICHVLTEKLVGMTMGNSNELRTPETLSDIVAIARRISPRVDDVVKSMYPPLDPRLLEARCTALVLSVSHLVLVTKNACRLSGVADWIDQSLADVEDHLKILREASLYYEHSHPSSPSPAPPDIVDNMDVLDTPDIMDITNSTSTMTMSREQQFGSQPVSGSNSFMQHSLGSQLNTLSQNDSGGNSNQGNNNLMQQYGGSVSMQNIPIHVHENSEV